MQGATTRHGVSVERAYWIAAPVVPMAEANLLVPSSGGGATPGMKAKSAGSCTIPPPPITASTTPAPNAAAPSAAQISSVPLSGSTVADHDEEQHADAHAHVAGDVELARARRADPAAHLQHAGRGREHRAEHREGDDHLAGEEPVHR